MGELQVTNLDDADYCEHGKLYCSICDPQLEYEGQRYKKPLKRQVAMTQDKPASQAMNIRWHRLEKGPRGGGGGLMVMVNGQIVFVIPDTPMNERLLNLLCEKGKQS